MIDMIKAMRVATIELIYFMTSLSSILTNYLFYDPCISDSESGDELHAYHERCSFYTVIYFIALPSYFAYLYHFMIHECDIDSESRNAFTYQALIFSSVC